MSLINVVGTNYRRLKKVRCHNCTGGATVQCDYPTEAGDKCGRACCPRHGCWWRGCEHLCKEHAESLDKWA